MNKQNEKLIAMLTKLYELEKKTNPDKLAKNAVDYLNDNSKGLQEDISVKLIKGGTYKIKGYYLENSLLPDIRGASSIITGVQEEIIPEYLKEKIGFDCVLYNGGGNLFAIVPDNCENTLPIELEKVAQDYLVTANSAYSISDSIKISQLFGENYKSITFGLENELNERKKSKIINNTAPLTSFNNYHIFDCDVNAEKLDKADEYCEHCKNRLAYYKKNGEFICGGCLHKISVNYEQKRSYYNEYINFIRKRGSNMELKMCNSFVDVDKDYIAVVYADGNNMGGIIQTINKVNEMMDFSAFVKEKMPEIVYGSLYDREIKNVVFTALGGDDIFIIVPAKKSLRLAEKLIEEYNRVFKEKYPKSNSTLSVGVCIAKPKTPVKVMLEAAEEELSKAKELVKSTNCSGSLSYVIFDSYEGVSGDRGRWTLLPYSLEAAKEILNMADKLRESNTGKTRINNLSEAFHKSEADAEANLFYEYTNAKSKKDNQIKLPKKFGRFELEKGFYKNTIDKSDNKTYSIWDDLLDLIKFGE